jgi:DNA polymerase III alpha subunit
MPVKGICVKELTKEIEQYNKYVGSDEWIKTKVDIRDLDFEWNIPQEYKELDVRARVYQILAANDRKTPEKSTYEHHARVDEELKLYERLGLMDVLRVLIYVINTLQTHNMVWGVGRGSSVASYILYLIGVHDIDSIKYDLNITDFLRVNES